MIISYSNEYLYDTTRSPIQNAAFEIVYKIRNERNIDAAATIFLNSNITIEQLSYCTIRLSKFDIAKLSDTIIKMKS